MKPEEMTAKMAALYEDEDFSAKAAACENAQQMAELFVREGLPITVEMMEAVLAAANEDVEMDEDDLDNVAGGVSLIRNSCILFPRPLPFPIPRPRPRWPFWRIKW